MVTPKFFIDARFGLNKILFPTYLNGNDQTLLDSATSIRTRNYITGTERWRDRYQANATAQYYVDECARRPARVQVRLRQRARAGREPGRAVRRCRLHIQQRHRPVAERDAVRRRRSYSKTGGRRHGALRAGQLLDQAPDAHRRRAMGAARRLPARAGQPGRAASSRTCRARSRSSATWSCGTRSDRASARSTT